ESVKPPKKNAIQEEWDRISAEHEAKTMARINALFDSNLEKGKQLLQQNRTNQLSPEDKPILIEFDVIIADYIQGYGHDCAKFEVAHWETIHAIERQKAATRLALVSSGNKREGVAIRMPDPVEEAPKTKKNKRDR